MPEIDVGAPVGALVDWLTANFGPLFSAISAVMLVLLDVVLIVLTAPSPYIVGVSLPGRRAGGKMGAGCPPTPVFAWDVSPLASLAPGP